MPIVDEPPRDFCLALKQPKPGGETTCNGIDDDGDKVVDEGEDICGIALCSGGSCSVCRNDCDSAEVGCTSLCEDRAHCGECNHACPETYHCVDGGCRCPANFRVCDGRCTYVSMDHYNCGDCGVVCPGDTYCGNGVCTCAPGFDRCGDSCVGMQIDANNCGACGQPCRGHCAEGRCWGALTFGEAGAILVDLDTGDRLELNYNLKQIGLQPALDAAHARVLSPSLHEHGIAFVDFAYGTLKLVSGCGSLATETPCVLYGAGPLFEWPVGLGLDPGSDRAIVSDRELDAIFTVDLTTHERKLVGPAGGAAAPLGALAVDAERSRALVLQGAAVIEVDLDTGARALWSGCEVEGCTSGATRGGGPQLDAPASIAVDRDRGRALVAASSALVAIDLETGDRTIASGCDRPHADFMQACAGTLTGSGPELRTATGVVLDRARGRALVMAAGQLAIVAVELESGDRSIVSGCRGPLTACDPLGAGKLFAGRQQSIVLTAE